SLCSATTFVAMRLEFLYSQPCSLEKPTHFWSSPQMLSLSFRVALYRSGATGAGRIEKRQAKGSLLDTPLAQVSRPALRELLEGTK
ncbi:MAG: hypothetical protein ABL890_04225, partial [Candidatus Peribacteraceae bacterium]